MKKIMQKIAVLLSSLLMLNSVFGGVVLTAHAAEAETITLTVGYMDGVFDSESSINIDGVDARSGSVNVPQASTHTISLQLWFGAAIDKMVVNDVEYTPDKGDEDWYTVTVPDASSYNITLRQAESTVATIVWAYDREDAIDKYGDDDAWVEHGIVEVISIVRDGNEIFNENTSDPGDFGIRSDGGDMFLEKGDEVIIRLIPEYGYQVKNVVLNDDVTLSPEDSVSTFKIDSLRGNLHLKGVFQSEEDIINNNSNSVSSANIGNAQNAVETGNVKLTVDDRGGYNPNLEGVVEGNDVVKVAAVDLSLENRVCKGTGDRDEDYWTDPVTEFEKPISVALGVDMKALKEGEVFTVVRDHEGVLEELETKIDKKNGIIEFETNKFSTYTIVKKQDPNQEQHVWDDGEMIKRPTMKEKGLLRFHCKNCEAYYDEELNVLTREMAVGDFVNRFYYDCLGREPEAAGMDYWYNNILKGNTDGATAGASFVFSEEYMGKKTTDTSFLRMLYKVFMDREADYDGLKYWQSQLKSGMSREEVFKAFVESKEYTEICKESNIVRGEYTIQGIKDPVEKKGDVTPEISNFVENIYSQILNRGSDVEGINYWCQEIANESKDPILVAELFIFSEEFENRKLNNADYVDVLYRTFMGREADKDGKNFWVKQLKDGKDRKEVLEAFANCKEFQDILRAAGL